MYAIASRGGIHVSLISSLSMYCVDIGGAMAWRICDNFVGAHTSLALLGNQKICNMKQSEGLTQERCNVTQHVIRYTYLHAITSLLIAAVTLLAQASEKNGSRLRSWPRLARELGLAKHDCSVCIKHWSTSLTGDAPSLDTHNSEDGSINA